LKKFPSSSLLTTQPPRGDGAVTQRSDDTGSRPLCIHNIGAETRLDDVLFAFEPTGHFRYFG
jgi:uncharacterized protein YijF (DUF1287 family)